MMVAVWAVELSSASTTLSLNSPMYILWEIVVVVDTGIGQPGGGFCGAVGALEGDLEVFDKVGEGSEGGGI